MLGSKKVVWTWAYQVQCSLLLLRDPVGVNVKRKTCVIAILAFTWFQPNSHRVCLFALILYVPSTIFQLYRDGSSWVEPVLNWDKCVLLKDHNAVTPVRLEPAALRSRVKHSLPLSHCAPYASSKCQLNLCTKWHSTVAIITLDHSRNYHSWPQSISNITGGHQRNYHDIS